MATRSSPEPLPSLPPSPTHVPVDDVARAWHDEPDAATHPGATRKGKTRAARSSDSDEAEEQGDEDEDSTGNGTGGGYPPTKEEEAESRRIAENLRRWEVAERQRRKAARESTASTSGGSTAPSILANLFQRESTSRRKASIGGVGAHHVLHDADADADPDADAGGNSVPLADMTTPMTAAFPAAHTPEPGLEVEAENPFETPSASRTSLNIPAHSAIMTESDSVPVDFASTAASSSAGPQRPTLEASTSYAQAEDAPRGGKGKSGSRSKKKQAPPPPQPFDLPAPRSPPPRTETPHAGKPPEPIPPPRMEPESEAEAERGRAQEAVGDPGPPVRWWHEWLCGCGEDRDGDHQAGRTNPFE
ncbi:hypothetical protein C2E23DRAFT_886604 [Lenzites betulinus]|nr:hypothetical protein C2E23DRAFT_886604 [Lenzites betulinus]